MDPSGAERGDLFFAVDARHVQQLGQQLVGDRVTAVSELIKNAYDADATRVVVEFETANGGSLTVTDDGSGMALDDVVGRWMRIATDDKEVHATSPRFHRSRAGRKGIGRFAAQTLGRRLELRTKVANSTDATVVVFDWDHDYATGRELGTVPNPWHTEIAPADRHGTTLSIQGLYDGWTVDDFDRVAKAIRMLQPPFPLPAAASPASSPQVIATADSSFSVVLIVDGDRTTADGVEDFLEASTAQVLGDVSADGTVSVYASGPRIGLDRLEDLPTTYGATGPLTFRAAYFVYRRDTIGGYGLRDAEQMGRRYGGVRVYRDGMRVLPYGEPDNDWLGLDLEYRSRSRTLVPIGNRNVFGQVLLSREANPELEDRASREGFIENVAYAQLRELLREAFVRSAIWVGEVRQRKTRASAKAPPSPTRRDMLAEFSSSVEHILREALPEPTAA